MKECQHFATDRGIAVILVFFIFIVSYRIKIFFNNYIIKYINFSTTSTGKLI